MQLYWKKYSGSIVILPVQTNVFFTLFSSTSETGFHFWGLVDNEGRLFGEDKKQ